MCIAKCFVPCFSKEQFQFDIGLDFFYLHSLQCPRHGVAQNAFCTRNKNLLTVGVGVTVFRVLDGVFDTAD